MNSVDIAVYPYKQHIFVFNIDSELFISVDIETLKTL